MALWSSINKSSLRSALHSSTCQRRSRHWPGAFAATALAITLLTSTARAAPPLPSPLHVDDALAYARQHRAEIESAKSKAAAAEKTPAVVSGLPDPMVMGSIDHLPFKGAMGADWSVMVQQEFPLSGILGAHRRAAEADAKAVASNVSTVSLDVELESLTAFLMRVEIDRMGTVVDEQVTISLQVLGVTRARLAGGEGSAAEVIRAEADVARLEGQRKQLDAEAVGANAMLNAALARPTAGALPPLEMTLPIAEPPPVAKLVALALERRPELATMKSYAVAANEKVSVMDAMYTPMAFARAGIAYRMDTGYGGMLLFGISIPLWREKLAAGVDEAKSMVAMADADVAAMAKMIEGDVAVARARVMAARVRVATSHDKVVPLSKKAVELTVINYASGESSLVAVLDATRMLREARMEEIAAELATARAWAALGRAIGAVKLGIT